MWKKLRQGETDLVIRVLPGNVGDYEMPNEYYDTRGLMVIPIFEHTFKIAMREGHPLSSKECVTIEELINYQILHFKFGDSFMGRLNCEAFMKLFTDRGLNPNLKQIEDDNDLLILNMVESSDCVAPVLDTTATESKKIIVRPICGSPYRMSVCLLCLKDNLTPGVKRFVEFITGKKVKNAVK
jgi:LysR substrate binding domain.